MTKQKWVIIILVVLVALTALGGFVFWKSQQNRYGGFEPFNCKPGFGCVVIEDKGKVKAANTPEAQALADKYGWVHVHVKALAHSALYEEGFIAKIHPQFKGKIGCIIFVHAGDNEGYMFVQDENLDIIYKESIHEFAEKTKNIDSKLMSKFYLSFR